MKSKIFSTDQIRAIQDGRMTQFMQVIKPQPDLITNVIGGVTWQQSKDKYIWGNDTAELLSDMMQECPFGKLGDILYCREDWAVNDHGEYEYRADGKEAPVLLCLTFEGLETINRWYPSATMPREAARLFLRITNIRVMRGGELTEQDALDQGYECIDKKLCPALVLLKTNLYDKHDIDGLEKYFWVIDFTKTDKP